jgi:hypothetical protein
MTDVYFSVDDVCPKPGFGLFINRDFMYLQKLYDEFGCKFTFFLVPFDSEKKEYHLSQNAAWFEKVKNLPYVEIAQHGLTHKPVSPELGGMELVNRPLDEIRQRIAAGKSILLEHGVNPKGFKTPGWEQPKEIYSILNDLKFEYIGDHFIGTKPIVYNGLKRIPYTISTEYLLPEMADNYKEGNLILHSHINPIDGRTKNAWTNENYTRVREFLSRLDKKTTTYKFIGDMK